MKTYLEQPMLHTEGPYLEEQMLHTKGRCFKMCEPDDLIYRDDKLMKPVVVHDGIKPTRFFLYLFPDEPQYGPEVGEPAYLTEFIRTGRIEEGKERARVRGQANQVTHQEELACHIALSQVCSGQKWRATPAS